MELDARTRAKGTILEADLCIVGGGPVGLSLAQALADSGLQVVLIESSGATRDRDLQELNAGDAIGDPYDELQSSRWRGVGGTAAIWNTVVRGAAGAKYLSLDEIDFESKPWAAWSGWPFHRDTLMPYYGRAQAVCGVNAFGDRVEVPSDERVPQLDSSHGKLAMRVYQFGKADQFLEVIPRALRSASAVTILHGATVTELIRDLRGGRITGVRWTSLGQGDGVVRASRFVLAAGAIENARLLLLHGRGSAGPVATNDWLGRGFMEHPIDSSLELISRSSALRAMSSFYGSRDVEGVPPVIGRIGLSPEWLRELKVPNASIRLVEDAEPQLLQAGAPRSAARRLVPFPAVRRLIGNSIRRVAAARNRIRGARYQLLIDLEQLPHRENRVVLSGKVDRFGLPRAELHWRWRDEDERGRVTVRDAIARELKRAGVGHAIVNAHRPLNPNAHHHSGTTRMHADPTQGVVDETLRVHGEENLYVAGSSVFPTSGFANPTLTAIAVALRLADELRGG